MHGFVDETKAKGLLVVAAVADSSVLPAARIALQDRRAKGQKRIHFAKESDPRRRAICATLVTLPIAVTVYDATAIRDQRIARQLCLEAIIEDLAAAGGRRLVIERDDSLVEADKRVLYAATHKLGVVDTLSYLHQRSHEEPLLWVPDAIAWCIARGGHWPGRVESLISEVRHLT